MSPEREEQMAESLTYSHKIFETPTEEEAKAIILIAEGGFTTEERWQTETPYLAELLGGKLGLQPGQLVVDYGCGLGRIAKEFIERHGCTVLGVDIAENMRGLAPGYVKSPRFSVVSRQVFSEMVGHGLRVDAAIAVWVLQHCRNPRVDLDLLRGSMKSSAPLAVVNLVARSIPTAEGVWGRDGVDVRAETQARFRSLESGSLDAAVVGESVNKTCYWEIYERPAD